MAKAGSSKSIKPKSVIRRRSETRALYAAGFSTAIATAIGLCYFWGEYSALFGRHSIGSLASLVAAIAAFVAFLAAYNWPLKTAPKLWHRVRDLLTVAALAFIHAAICLLVVAVVFFLAQNAFLGLKLDQWVAAVLTGVSAGICGYAAYLAGSSMTTLRLSTSLAIFLVTGMMASMITANDPYWWQLHFSSLGAGGTGSAVAFNLTLIVAGLVIICLADFIAADFGRLSGTSKPARVNTIRIMLTIIGLMLAGVGLFKYDQYPQLHFYSAAGMAFLFLAMMAALPRLAPNFSKAFIIFSYAIMGVILACVWLWKGVGYLNLTAFELVCTAIIFAWLVVFVRNLAVQTELSR